jgi:phosphoesterase RecJ-like protein
MSLRPALVPPAELVAALRSARRVALFTHLNPDGDGLGSEAALASALRALGKDVAVLNGDPTPRQYAFLGLERYAAPEAYAADVAVSLDCPVLSRLGKGAERFQDAPKRLVIDHHVAKEPFGDIVWIEEKAAATGEMMEALLGALGAEISPECATAMYAAVVNDTGCFRHSNTDQRIFELAARLLRAGAESVKVNRQLLDTKPLAAIQLWSRVLGRLRMLAGGRGAMVSVSQADLDAVRATWEETDGLAETLRSIEGVEASAMLRDEGPGRVKVSMRSKSSVDVNAVAMRFGGGGHAKAAGATLSLSLPEAEKAVESALSEALAAFKG